MNTPLPGFGCLSLTMGVSNSPGFMKKNHDQARFKEEPQKVEREQSPTPDYSALVALGALIALIALSGCASPAAGAGSDPTMYNANTGYPAVGSSNSGL